MDTNLTLDVFLPLVSTSIPIESAGGMGGEVRLLEAKPLGPASDEGPSGPFVLVFLAPVSADVQQGMLRLRHETLGALDLFVVPARRTEEGVCLEAIFN